ncbi:MAG: DUF4440 domain-containing protein [Lewinellaceae bacterium]|nr:DUF4440 domain-containing protein [Lewinellaceae bacterium]
MKKLLFCCLISLSALPAKAWWDAGHLVTAMIAYLNLDDQARARVDELTALLQRDYPYANHFITLGTWPDDLKAEGVRTYDTWHYTNIPLMADNVALPPQPEIDVIWAINQMNTVLRSSRPKNVDRARHLGFLVHFVGDIHQPLHSTSVFDNDLPAGNVGGNAFPLKSPTWRNLHSLWDDGCGYLSSLGDINPFGQAKQPLTEGQIEQIRQLAQTLMQAYPASTFPAIDELDPRFWALESHRLAVKYGYRGVNGKDDRGRDVLLQPDGTPSDYYLEQGQEVVRHQLVLGGYRLARQLNSLFGRATPPDNTQEKIAVRGVIQRLFDAMAANDSKAAEAVMLPEAALVSIRMQGDKKVVQTSTGKDFIKGLGKSKQVRLERFWDPVILIDGDVATARAPYDLHIDGKFDHCGTDMFTLVKATDGWKISGVTWDVLMNCPPSPLGPVKN